MTNKQLNDVFKRMYSCAKYIEYKMNQLPNNDKVVEEIEKLKSSIINNWETINNILNDGE